MISLVLIAMLLIQAPGNLQPGTGIVTGSVQMEGGGSPAGVRVGAMAIDDPSSLASVTETDSAGRYRLINIPQGKYYIVAGRLDDLIYFPGGKDKTKATEINVEAAKIIPISSFTVPAQSKRPAPRGDAYLGGFTLPSSPEDAAFAHIRAELNAEARKKLMLNFEKTFPKSKRMPEVYIDLSRTLALQSDFSTAAQYAGKAVEIVSRMKTDPGFDAKWIAALDTSVKSNLAWVKQMVTWQQQQLQANILHRR